MLFENKVILLPQTASHARGTVSPKLRKLFRDYFEIAHMRKVLKE